MLTLKNIKKHYETGGCVTKALAGVSITFRKTEFVAILGASGSGKTTLLNIIGGLDQYDVGDLLINGRSTKYFAEADWDAYRNNSIGFIFQSYNLIHHLGILANVELGMTLSGVSKEEKTRRALEALARVGLQEHIHKKPSQLSGGQMQRVAIARALANDPKILLCDEPTGALDSETSQQIMALIHELAQERLVIMVTHNPELAQQYASRIITFSDGQIMTDSNPQLAEVPTDSCELKHTKMSFLTALMLSFHNIRTKKGRTFLTAFATSIGIIGIAIILSLSSGFQTHIDDTQSETLSKFPITIAQKVSDQSATKRIFRKYIDEDCFLETDRVVAAKSPTEDVTHTNQIDQEFIDYLQQIDPELSDKLGFVRPVNLNLLRKIDDEVTSVKFSNDSGSTQQTMISAIYSNSGIGISTFPKELLAGEQPYLKENYSLLAGEYPKGSTDLALIIDKNNKTNVHALRNIGFDVNVDEELHFHHLIGTTIKLVKNDDFYDRSPSGLFYPTADLNELYDNPNNVVLTLTSILRVKPDSAMELLSPGIVYSDELSQMLIEDSQQSEIVKAQEEADKNVMTNEPLDAQSKQELLGFLGGHSTPASIMVYANNFKDKDQILDYLDAYNKGRAKDDKIMYVDMAKTMTDLTGGLMSAITYVLIAFAGISLVTSMIMISILTYTSVIERTNEIGILKALGARKKDIIRVFDAETCILGGISGILGVTVAWLLTFPINVLLYQITDLKNIATLEVTDALLLFLISTALTMLGGHIPARMAAKKDAAAALRTE